MDDIYTNIATKIIEQQETIIGPVAVEQAKGVTALTVDWPKHSVSITGSATQAIDDLVRQYKELFGQIAVETCKEAVSKYLSQLAPENQPKSLQ